MSDDFVILDVSPANDGTLAAVQLLMNAHEAVRFSPRLRRRIEHAIARLDAPLEAELFGESRTLVPDTEQAALAMLQGTAKELREAGAALLEAADTLKNKGAIMPAQKAHLAGKAAFKAAGELVNG